MKQFFSLFLILSFILSPVAQVWGQDQQDQEDKDLLEGLFGDDESQESEPVILTHRQEILKSFNDLKESVDQNSSDVESFGRLKNRAQHILNAPSVRWEESSTDFLIAELEESLSTDFKTFERLKPSQRVFWDPKSETLDAFSLTEKEKIFIAFEESAEAFKKMLILAHSRDDRKDTSLFDGLYLELSDSGIQDFDQFVSRPNYHVLSNKIIPRLSESMGIEQEALGEIKDEAHWKNLLRRSAIDLYINRWVELDRLWIRERFPMSQRISVLPISCQNQYFSLHPLTIPSLLEEQKSVPSRALFEAQFYTRLSQDSDLVIPVLASDDISKKLISLVPAWKSEYEALNTVNAELSEKLVSNLTFTLLGMENLFARYVLSWVFGHEQPSQEKNKEQIFQDILKAKKLLLWMALERFLVDSGATVSKETKEVLLSYIDELVQDHKDEFMGASQEITEFYETAQKQVRDIEGMIRDQTNPKVSVDKLLESALETSRKVLDQDQKIAALKNGEKLLPIQDTPQNFKLATLVFAGDLREIISKDSFDEIEKILFLDDGTYETAYYRYQEWLKTFQGSSEIKKDVIAVARALGLNHYQFLASLFVDVKKRILFEELLRSQYLMQEPILSTDVKYVNQGGRVRPLYEQLLLAQVNKETHEILVDLIQRAVWEMKAKVTYELDRFCGLGINTEGELKFLLANSVFRHAAFSRMSVEMSMENAKNFLRISKINDEAIQAFEEQAAHQGTFRNAIGYGFLTIIGLSFLSGPMSRLPWWLGGRFMPRIPHGILKVSEIFGIGAAPFAMWWMAEDTKRLFWDEGYHVQALEHWYDTQVMGSDQSVTVVDVLKAQKVSHDPTDATRDVKNIIKSRLELRISQGSFLLFAPIQYAFIKGMFSFGYSMYSQSLPFTRRVGVTAALGKLYVPTRFWTLKPGNELLMLSGGELKTAYLNAVDRSMTVPQLKKYVEKWLVLLRRQLSFHEANYGTAATWEQTTALIKNKAKIQERQYLIVELKLYETALTVIKESGAAKVSELAFKQRFTMAMEDLEILYFGQNLARFYPQDELVWIAANIRTEKFFNHWFGGWVGWHGPLGRALQKMQAYQYLSSQRGPLLLSVLRQKDF